MKLKTAYPLLWNYTAAAIDESCAPGIEFLDALEVVNDVLAIRAEAELVKTGLNGREIWDRVYECDPSVNGVLLSEWAEEYVNFCY